LKAGVAAAAITSFNTFMAGYQLVKAHGKPVSI
jgi:hypothetical protein